HGQRGRGRGHARRDLRPPPRGLRRPPAVGHVLRTRLGPIVGLVAAGVLALASSAGAGMADRIGATFVMMSDQFIKAFNPLEGLVVGVEGSTLYLDLGEGSGAQVESADRKSTRLNSSHVAISYAVFCLKKK